MKDESSAEAARDSRPVRRHRARIRCLAAVTAAVWSLMLLDESLRALAGSLLRSLCIGVGVTLGGMVLAWSGFAIAGAAQRLFAWIVRRSRWPADERF